MRRQAAREADLLVPVPAPAAGAAVEAAAGGDSAAAAYRPATAIINDPTQARCEAWKGLLYRWCGERGLDAGPSCADCPTASSTSIARLLQADEYLQDRACSLHHPPLRWFRTSSTRHQHAMHDDGAPQQRQLTPPFVALRTGKRPRRQGSRARPRLLQPHPAFQGTQPSTRAP